MGCSSSKSPTVNPLEIDLSHFRTENIIGQGGFGKVYCVSRIRDNEMYAMKSVAKVACLNKSSGIEQVFTEMRLLSKLKHPFICNSHHAFQDECFLYIVMDLALGGDLKFTQQNRTGGLGVFDEDQARFYLGNMVLALSYLHTQSMLHRDIKPENVVLKEDGYCLLTDVGISTEMELGQELVFKHSGTHGFMAPEVYSVSGHGTQSEWFSVGICLHVFATGQCPFKTAKELPPGGNERLPLLDKAKKPVSTECKELIRTLLHPDPAQRLTAAGIKTHSWFNGFDWLELEKQALKPPFVPDIRQANCDTGDENLMDQLGGSAETAKKPTVEQQEKFKSYRHNTTPPNMRRSSLRRSTVQLGSSDAVKNFVAPVATVHVAS
jgi:serine/threonine protein kinase